jgi:hypothetical protein
VPVVTLTCVTASTQSTAFSLINAEDGQVLVVNGSPDSDVETVVDELGLGEDDGVVFLGGVDDRHTVPSGVGSVVVPSGTDEQLEAEQLTEETTVCGLQVTPLSDASPSATTSTERLNSEEPFDDPTPNRMSVEVEKDGTSAVIVEGRTKNFDKYPSDPDAVIAGGSHPHALSTYIKRSRPHVLVRQSEVESDAAKDAVGNGTLLETRAGRGFEINEDTPGLYEPCEAAPQDSVDAAQQLAEMTKRKASDQTVDRDSVGRSSHRRSGRR